ncbi:MAG: nucleoside permease [Phycisphaerales bacterium]|nr:nucleoside permease [Planctomycetota bacterium]MCH8508317.1 nucleoside permease [Phycisphaerales bacterium]
MAEPGQRSGTIIATQLSVMMFLQFFLWGAWYVTMGPYMAANNMGPTMIGWAYTVGPIAAIASPFFLGMVADRFFATERVLGVMHLLGGLFLCLAPMAAQQSPSLFVVMILLHMLCYMPTLGLSSSLALHNMTNAQTQFPLIRVFGTVGWIVANFVISQLAFDRSPNMFFVAGGSGLLLGLFSFFLPHTPAPAKGRPFSARDALGLDALVLLRSRSFAVFAVCSFLLCIPLAAYYAFAGQFVGEMGIERIAQTMSLGQMSEIIFMLVMPVCFARLGVKWMLTIGMAAWVVRYGLFSTAADEQIRWMVLGGIILHGICYDFFFVTGQIYVDGKAGAKIRSQAQGFYVLITQGLGMLIGAQVASRLVARHTDEVAGVDWKTVWMYPAVFALAVLIVFVLLFKDRVAPPKPQDIAPSTPGGPDPAQPS